MTPDERRAAVARRDREKARRADRARYLRDRPKRRAAMDAYAAANPAVIAAAKSRWAKRNREKRNAQAAARRAIERGELERQPCEVCGAAGAHAHHDDYSRRLDVRWLCPAHHAEHHRNEREARR